MSDKATDGSDDDFIEALFAKKLSTMSVEEGSGIAKKRVKYLQGTLDDLLKESTANLGSLFTIMSQMGSAGSYPEEHFRAVDHLMALSTQMHMYVRGSEAVIAATRGHQADIAGVAPTLDLDVLVIQMESLENQLQLITFISSHLQRHASNPGSISPGSKSQAGDDADDADCSSVSD